jgi:hypothetical protein
VTSNATNLAHAHNLNLLQQPLPQLSCTHGVSIASPSFELILTTAAFRPEYRLFQFAANMVTPIKSFSASELAQRVQYDLNGKRRKGPPIDLVKDCQLQEMIQHSCNVVNEKSPSAIIVCHPLVRTFRRSVLQFLLLIRCLGGEGYFVAAVDRKDFEVEIV